MEQQQIEELRKAQPLAQSVGEFIRYWGFRNIHGEIWAMVYLSESPLSGKDLTDILDVSKALVSPALHELVEEGLITATESENSKTKRYEAVEDVMTIIKDVLNRRERPMMDRITQSHAELKSGSKKELNPERLLKMGKMIQSAEMALLFLSEPGEPWM